MGIKSVMGQIGKRFAQGVTGVDDNPQMRRKPGMIGAAMRAVMKRKKGSKPAVAGGVEASAREMD